jgi:hypothetical protein
MRRQREEIYTIRHHSLFSPRDFDLSPYFAVVKPTIERGFDYRGINWHDGLAEENDVDVAQAQSGGHEAA